jgi:hypothetical protein
MTEKTGTLHYEMSDSLLDETLLARRSANPFGEATNYLKSKGLVEGDEIWVTGDDGSIGTVPVFFMIDASSSRGLEGKRKEITEERTGTLHYDEGGPMLDGIRLARRSPNPFGAIINDLKTRGFKEGQEIRVTGKVHTIGSVQVFFVSSASPLGDRSLKGLPVDQQRRMMRKATSKKAGRKVVKRAVTKTRSTKKAK